ncbi:long-chain fatty acid--CoA ligase [Actinomadura sp. KC06]|uniref:AMP-binding protein n=1 Tax=Actinomadura sp. KC06 TaxID=2530369 RepID=UPI00104E1BB9|nr:AMP-binding protein [Actinomadura sp. KC06]TDD35874.1 long-chain fatty acid--CoA ligase [Actinomadura sp. KC06]
MDDRFTGSLADMADHWAREAPEGPATGNAGGRLLTFGALAHRSAQVANALADSGGPVAYLGRDSAVWAELMVGANRRGVPAVPLNWRLAPGELARVLDHARPGTIVSDAAYLPALGVTDEAAGENTVVLGGDLSVAGGYDAWLDGRSAVADPRPADPGAATLLIYTSGTSGQPKAVQLTNGNIAANLTSSAPWEVGPGSVVCVPSPLFHVSGTGWLFYCLGRGARSVFLTDASPEGVLRVLQDVRATHMLSVPAVVQTLVQSPAVAGADLSSLDTLIYGGSPMPPAVIEEARTVLGCDLVQSYGMTEACGPITFLGPEDHRRGGARLASAGRAADGVEIQIRDPGTENELPAGATGEVWMRSALLTPGYLGGEADNARAFRAGGWFRTGDAGHLDGDGYLFLTDRITDMIITGGENVHPVEVENVLAEHPDVAEVAVVGVPDQRWGETVAAMVVARGGAVPTEPELIAFCRDRLAHYKCPTRVDLVGELPRTPSGKVLKRRLRELAVPRVSGAH